MRVSPEIVALAVCLCAGGGPAAAQDEPPPDDLLEFLGAWDEAWTAVCDAGEGASGDADCATVNDEDENDEDVGEKN